MGSKRMFVLKILVYGSIFMGGLVVGLAYIYRVQPTSAQPQSELMCGKFSQIPDLYTCTKTLRS